MKSNKNILIESYSNTTKSLHWITAILVFTNYAIGLSLDGTKWYSIHKQIGFSILLLVLMRIMWRLSHIYPAPVNTLSKVEKILSVSVHHLLYVFMLLVPLSGLIMVNSFGQHVTFFEINIPSLISKLPQNEADMFAVIHSVLASTFIAFVGLHIFGALKHYIFDKDKVLSRMLPNFKKMKDKKQEH